jgi:hypothetical protein
MSTMEDSVKASKLLWEITQMRKLKIMEHTRWTA